MLFSYLNLPQIPLELEHQCLKNIELIDNDTRLNELNKKEGIGHSITYLPPIVKQWLHDNIIVPNFNPVPSEMLGRAMLHVSHYIKHSEGTGVHPTHIDYGRNYALNYVIDTGGDNVSTYWTTDDKETVEFETIIESRRWHIIRVNPTWHGVRGIKLGRLRTVISLCYNSPVGSDSFDAVAYFKSILS
jgi:hypothetical protein